MGKVEKISVALPAELAALLESAVESGQYASVSEVVREALRAWKRAQDLRAVELDELRRLWREGLNSGPATTLTAERIQAIKSRGRALLDAGESAG